MRFAIGREGESKTLLDTSKPYVNTTLAQQSESSSLRFHIVVWGGKTVDDVEVLRRFVRYATTRETFMVSNHIFGGDPQYGSKKWCFVASKRGGEDEEMRYLVAWEGERRSFL